MIFPIYIGICLGFVRKINYLWGKMERTIDKVTCIPLSILSQNNKNNYLIIKTK